MKFNTLLIISITFILSISRCDHFYCIFVQNNSANTINAIPSYNFPDTLLPGSKGGMIYVEPNQKNNFGSMEKWEDIINKIPSRTISIFILDANIVKTIPWDTIRNNNNYLKRYDLTTDSLNKLNWTVTYP